MSARTPRVCSNRWPTCWTRCKAGLASHQNLLGLLLGYVAQHTDAAADAVLAVIGYNQIRLAVTIEIAACDPPPARARTDLLRRLEAAISLPKRTNAFPPSAATARSTFPSKLKSPITIELGLRYVVGVVPTG